MMHRADGRGAGALPEEWHASVVGNLRQADATLRQAVGETMNGMSGMRQTNADHGRQRDTLHAQISQKIRNTEELAQQLSTRMRCNKAAIEHSEWSLQKLKAALQALGAPIELCKSRLSMREKRPKRERIFDGFQEALLHEEKELQVAKQRIIEAIADTQRHMKILMQHREELNADLNDKRHALSLDSVCIDKKAIDMLSPSKLDKCYNRKGVPIKMVLPELASPRDSPGGPDTNGRGQERERQKATLKNIEAAMKVEQEAKERWQQTADLLERCQTATSTAFKATQAEMGAKIEQTELLKQELLKQSRLTDQRMGDTHKTLSMTSDKLNFIEKPMAANLERTRIRGQRTPREAATDEVSEALHSQQQALQGKKLHLQSQANSLAGTMDDLGSTRRSLLEDIADKDRALAIDRSCAAMKNDAHGNLSFGFGKVGQGQRHFADTASSKMRQMQSPTVTRSDFKT
mmetsp:Transcript_2058/g.6885  ORF Transcript_2058/g.6885 Transcript_2058/m.6885 type:complete len:463 (-) Transcript_2058:88-1476(-)|eukprot:CAMPEP_0204515048 /NCGR_PEP_ID=MMETSP0661-20131031/2406_1 /ASSEMBLY_ACC=CAM_ASM_000606 /TAXON_ID=109239 /ORGANISM="Alexandrium margalefi, Strain AMGDE01CS-322" /LENGTH=462 /DNA_ID=CAMNT_0051520343 /DNA_START=29 /DNA_END=1417 /DNA_ORIENTATION=+